VLKPIARKIPKGQRVPRGKHVAGRAAEHARLETAFQGHQIYIAEVLGYCPSICHLQASSTVQPFKNDQQLNTQLGVLNFVWKSEVFKILRKHGFYVI